MLFIMFGRSFVQNIFTNLIALIVLARIELIFTQSGQKQTEGYKNVPSLNNVNSENKYFYSTHVDKNRFYKLSCDQPINISLTENIRLEEGNLHIRRNQANSGTYVCKQKNQTKVYEMWITEPLNYPWEFGNAFEVDIGFPEPLIATLNESAIIVKHGNVQIDRKAYKLTKNMNDNVLHVEILNHTLLKENGAITLMGPSYPLAQFNYETTYHLYPMTTGPVQCSKPLKYRDDIIMGNRTSKVSMIDNKDKPHELNALDANGSITITNVNYFGKGYIYNSSTGESICSIDFQKIVPVYLQSTMEKTFTVNIPGISCPESINSRALKSWKDDMYTFTFAKESEIKIEACGTTYVFEIWITKTQELYLQNGDNIKFCRNEEYDGIDGLKLENNCAIIKDPLNFTINHDNEKTFVKVFLQTNIDIYADVQRTTQLQLIETTFTDKCFNEKQLQESGIDKNTNIMTIQQPNYDSHKSLKSTSCLSIKNFTIIPTKIVWILPQEKITLEFTNKKGGFITKNGKDKIPKTFTVGETDYGGYLLLDETKKTILESIWLIRPFNVIFVDNAKCQSPDIEKYLKNVFPPMWLISKKFMSLGKELSNMSELNQNTPYKLIILDSHVGFITRKRSENCSESGIFLLGKQGMLC